MNTKMIKLVGLFAVSGMALSAPTAIGATYIDEDDYTSGGNSISAGGFFNGNFNITSSNTDADGDTVGYSPALETITSAFASFELFSPVGNVSSLVTVTLDSEALTLLSFDGVLSYVDGFLGATAYITLNTLGVLDYKVVNNGTDSIFFNKAILEATAGDRLPGTNVPDAGATVVLLGLGCVGVSALLRRRVVAVA